MLLAFLRGNQNIFLPPPFDLLLSLSSLISVFCYLLPSVYVSVSYLPRLTFAFVFVFISDSLCPHPLQVNSPFVFMVCFFLLSFCLFLFIPLPFLDPVLSVLPQLLTLSGWVYKLQIPYPAWVGIHTEFFLYVSGYVLPMCFKNLTLLISSCPCFFLFLTFKD